MFNQFTGIGRLAADPESRFTQTGKQVVNFTVCCDSGYGDNKRTEFVKCVAWEKLAGVCSEYLSKGSMVFIKGEMRTRKYQDQSGNDRFITEISVRDMKMLSARSGEGRGSGFSGPPQNSTGEDVPFS